MGVKNQEVSKLPLSPMLVQYLVGLCCLKWHPDAVDVTLGDMVLDPAASKKRDVDITVTVSESGNITYAFKAYEVKREGSSLDVAEVEQLCLKLLDMPSVTHRAIVSASGFTASAQAKAARHSVVLYTIGPWVGPLQEQFPAFEMQGTAEECFPMSKILLCWINWQIEIVACKAKGPFTVQQSDSLYDASGKAHSKYPTFADYRDELLLRSTEVLCTLEPALTVSRIFPIPFIATGGAVSAGPAWPHTHTLDVLGDNVFVQVEQGLIKVDAITISGSLQWQRAVNKAHYCVMQQIPSGEAFAGALISPGEREGSMTALVFSPKTREIGIHQVRLAEKHLNSIKELKLKQPSALTDSPSPAVPSRKRK